VSRVGPGLRILGAGAESVLREYRAQAQVLGVQTAVLSAELRELTR